MNKNLEQSLVKLGAANPELRPHIRPLLNKQGALNVATSTWDQVVSAYLLETVKEVGGVLGKTGDAEALDQTLVYCNVDVEGKSYSIQINLMPTGKFQVKLSPTSKEMSFSFPDPRFEFDFRNDLPRGFKPSSLAMRLAAKLRPHLV